MAYPESSSPRRKPIQEFYVSHNEPYHGGNYGLQDLPYTTPLDSDVYYGLPQGGVGASFNRGHVSGLAPFEDFPAAGGPPQPISPDYSDYVGPWPLALNSAPVYSSYTKAEDLGGLFPNNIVFDNNYSTPPTTIGCLYNTWDSLSSQATPATLTSLSFLSSPPPLSPFVSVSSKTTVRPHSCDDCPTSFRHPKDLKRHKSTVHATGDECAYSCRCGKRGVRKDNYLRHVEKCYRELLHPEYKCKCEIPSADKDTHMQHVSNCQHGAGRTGRPPTV
ncbi:hypothetical protein F4801DRAFT_30162 [Xylaria longipes]|nr:hypothetical protein F4801DRAFT_30162 [Xylaria longipes]RYC63412.1 hypothetical protein CHU98_g2776 [Xylaria longipes]